MTLPTDPRDYRAHIPQQHPEPTEQVAVPHRPRRRWPLLAAALVVVLAAAGTAYALLADGGKDSGVVACERAAERAASGQTADASDDKDVQLLKDSEHADLREVGEAIDGAAAGDLADAMKVGVQMMAACARHGVVIDPS